MTWPPRYRLGSPRRSGWRASGSQRNSETSPSMHDPHRHQRRHLQRHPLDAARGRASMAGTAGMPHPRRGGRPRPSEGHAQPPYTFLLSRTFSSLHWFSGPRDRGVDGFGASRGNEGAGRAIHLDGARPRGFLMSKVALAIGLAGLLLATASTTGSSAMTIVPLSKSAISGPSSDLDLVRWRNCWRDRWGNRRCNWCWRDRWGRVRCG
jgi:hypothetical protein